MITLEMVASFVHPLKHYATESADGVWAAIVREDGAEIRHCTWAELEALTEGDESVMLSRIAIEKCAAAGYQHRPSVVVTRLCNVPGCNRQHAHLMMLTAHY